MLGLVERMKPLASESFVPKTPEAAIAQLVVVALEYRQAHKPRGIGRKMAIGCIRRANKIKRGGEWQSWRILGEDDQ